MFLLLACAQPPAPAVHLLPIPAEIGQDEGALILDEGTRILSSTQAASVAEQLARELRPGTGLPLEVVQDAHLRRHDIELRLGADLPPEAYHLTIDDRSVQLEAADLDGLYWGGQTLRQLLPPATLGGSPAADPLLLPRLEITDAPRFPWRGSMIDLARHFFGVDTIERHLDQMALHKLNRLHLHLTDDQGWRIEIPGWPELTAIGGATQVGGGEGGFLTVEDYAEVVAYAADRHIDIVPEIDLPGHCNAALASVGALNPDGQPTEPYTGTQVGFSTLWLEGPQTARFVEEVWGAVADMSPGEVVHIGADESHATTDEDYAAFVPQLQALLTDQGKIVVGWDEAGATEVGAPLYLQWWLHPDKVAAGVARGARVISSPAQHAYLDMVYELGDETGASWIGAVDEEAAYDWDPVPEGLEEADVAGVEGALWTEWVETVPQLDHLQWPRLAGIAELGWSQAQTHDWATYSERLAFHGARLEALGIAYRRSEEIDWQTP